MTSETAPSTTEQEPQLQTPGAGLPPLENFILRTVGFGIVGPMVSWKLARRVLIPRITAIEDSSRYWSPAMTLAHLVIVGEAIADFVVRLSRGESIEGEVRIQDVKPDHHTLPNILDDYRAFLPRFDRTLSRDVVNQHSPCTHPHPWVGPLTARQWLNLGAVHQRVHRKQIEKILQLGGMQP
ncbi:DinB family protein [Pseudomonadota bacterium]